MSDPFDGLMGQQPPPPHQPPAALGHRLEGARPAALSQAAQPSPRYHQYHQNQPHLQPRLHSQQMGLTGGGVGGQGYPQHGWHVGGMQYYASQQHQQQQQQQSSLVSAVGYPTGTALAQPAGQQVVPGVPWPGLSSSGVGVVSNPTAVGSAIGYRPQRQQQQQQHLQFPPHSGTHFQRQNLAGWNNSVRHPSSFVHGQETTLTTSTSSATAAVGDGPTTVASNPGQQQPAQQPMTSALCRGSVQDSAINAGAAVVSRGGAEWSPPGEQLAAYESMFAAASSGSVVPGSVSGRAAVQFFSRSELPKDVLKMIWSLCDPALTGSIQRTGFFAAMRLISIVQGSAAMAAPSTTTPPSLRAALEATRHALLPPPRMDGLSFPSSTTGNAVPGNVGPPQQPVAVISGASGAPPAAASSGMRSPFSPKVSSGKVGGVHTGAGVLSLVGSNLPVEGRAVGTVGLGAEAGAGAGAEPSPFSDLLSSSSVKHSDGITEKADVAAAGVMSMSDLMVGSAAAEAPATATATAAEEQGEGDKEEEDDDFGDFEGAEDPARTDHPPQPALSPGADAAAAAATSPLVAFQPTKTENDEDDEDFGDFWGAPDVIGEAFAEAVASTPSASAVVSASAAEEAAAVAVASGQTPASMLSKDGQSGGASVMEGGVGQQQEELGTGGRESEEGGGLDKLMRSNLKEAVSRPVHLADMQSTPSLLGKPHDPVMVDRGAAGGGSSKLSVFDAMADLDLAVGQEEWNDFADETTAPPRSSTPPPRPLPTAPAFLENALETSSAPDAAPSAAAAVVAVSLGESGGVKVEHGNSVTLKVGGFPTSVEAVVGEESRGDDVDGNEDDWGDFEDAGGAGGERVEGEMTPGPITISEGEGEGEGGDGEEWGEFEEVPAAVMVAGSGSEGGTKDGGSGEEEPGSPKPDVDSDSAVAREEDPVNAESPEAPEPDDPFADIAPRAPSPPPLMPPQDLGNSTNSGEGAGGGDVEKEGQGEGDDDRGLEIVSGSVEKSEELGGASTITKDSVEESLEMASAAVAAEVVVPGVPLSLRALRDRLSARGRLEEAVEVERKMELPTSPTPIAVSPAVKLGESANDGSADAGMVADSSLAAYVFAEAKKGSSGGGIDDKDGEDPGSRDLKRWRAAVDEPPEPTLEELARQVAEVDAGREEAFREAFVTGRPSVEEEALAHGGAVSLGNALKRQRAARRAALLSRFFVCVPESSPGGADKSTIGDSEEEVDLGFGGLESGRGRPPASLSDWARMTAFVTRAVKQGLAAISEDGGDERAETVEGREEGGEGRGSSSALPAYAFSPPSQRQRQEQERGDAVAGGNVYREVARSSKFETFCRGLGEAVGVCRMLQAAAEDALESVKGFAELERTWKEFLERVRDVRRGDKVGAVSEAGEEDWLPGGVGSGTVEEIRELVRKEARAGSTLCAVCFQPLDVVFAGVSSPALKVVEYCGVRYFSGAINLWVNVLDKAPPGAL